VGRDNRSKRDATADRHVVHGTAASIDQFDGLTSLPDWLRNASHQDVRWALQAILVLADAAPHVGWRGDMRHLPSVGVMLNPPDTTPYLVVKQDNNGATFVVTAAGAAEIATTASTHVAPRRIGASTHPTADDISIINAEHVAAPPRLPDQEPAF
jgi:hypothetical protein